MLPSFHDDYLVSYEVNCEARCIRLWIREWEAEGRVRTVVFNGVEGYHFDNDAFGNIIFSLETVPIDGFISDYGSKIADSYRLAGAPGPGLLILVRHPGYSPLKTCRLLFCHRLMVCPAGYLPRRR
jgi:hypothetical protein